MWTFIYAGALYLVGVAIILVVKPKFMFTPDGNWKEFGIGQNDARYTVFPFWLFCIVWALVSYAIITMIVPRESSQPPDEVSYPQRNSNRRQKNTTYMPEEDELVFDDDIEEPKLKKGYYMLNRKASKIAGVPKYVYLGEEEPHID
jgi:hypothetical protein